MNTKDGRICKLLADLNVGKKNTDELNKSVATCRPEIEEKNKIIEEKNKFLESMTKESKASIKKLNCWKTKYTRRKLKDYERTMEKTMQQRNKDMQQLEKERPSWNWSEWVKGGLHPSNAKRLYMD